MPKLTNPAEIDNFCKIPTLNYTFKQIKIIIYIPIRVSS